MLAFTIAPEQKARSTPLISMISFFNMDITYDFYFFWNGISIATILLDLARSHGMNVAHRQKYYVLPYAWRIENPYNIEESVHCIKQVPTTDLASTSE